MKHSEEKSSHWKVLMFSWIVVICLWAANAIISLQYSPTDRGLNGDMFGAVNALFSGLALATLIYAAWLQRKQLDEERESTARAREDAMKQEKLYTAQEENLITQRFESTFFELLRVHGSIVEAMQTVSDSNAKVHGRECFKTFYLRLCKAHAEHAVYPDPSNPLPAVQAVYNKFYLGSQSEIGHYFRHLYHIFKLVNEAKVENKQRYASLVRAQLSSHEHILFFYNGLSTLGLKKFHPLIEKFALLENMAQNLIILPHIHKPLYSESAYGEDA